MSAQRAHARPPGGRRAAPGLTVVRRRDRARSADRKVLSAGLVAVVAAVAVVFGVLLEQVVLGQSAFKLAELRTGLAAAEARHEELLLEAARLESPDRIERYARTSLGMTEPVQVEYVVADVGRGSRALLARVPRAERLADAAGLATGATER